MKNLAGGVAKQGFTLIDEFKQFAIKGNAIDLAVGVVIGAAFGKIIDSLVKNIIMPSIAVVMPGEQGYVEWVLKVGEKEIPYGLFLGEVVNFLIVALALFFFIVKFLGFVLRTKEKEAEGETEPVLSKEEELLTEIRDLLKEKDSSAETT